VIFWLLIGVLAVAQGALFYFAVVETAEFRRRAAVERRLPRE